MTHPLKHLTARLARLARPVRRPLAAAALALVAGGALAAPLDDIRRQVEASQFDQAYQTAVANPQLIGDVHFDFLYGVAAINVGRVPEGLLALERHLAAVPANDRARLELARGYFLLGEYTRARSEFEFVLRYNPPAGVRSNIAGFLQAMQVRESSDNRATARFYAEVGAGHDNNVNGGTYNAAYDIGGATFQPDPVSRQVSDDFAQVAIGGQKLLRVSNRMSVFAGADLDHRGHFKREEYNITNANLYVGFSQLSGLALWRATLGANQLMVGGNRYRDTLQVNAEANVTLAPTLAVQAFGQYADRRHAGIDRPRDARVTAFGAMLSFTPQDFPWQPTFGTRLTYTQEDNTRQRRDFSKQEPQLRVFASVSPLQRLRVSAGITGYTQRYGGEDVIFASAGDTNARRKDKAVSGDVLANYAIDANWSVRLEGQWLINHSNQDLYDYARKSLAMKLRYQY